MKRAALALVAGLTAALGGAALVSGGAAEPPPMAPASERIDLIKVDKSERRLELWRDGRKVREYAIALGASPLGHKTQEGDERTPVGDYAIDWRNPNSSYHLSLHISYPNADDVAEARRRGVSPGGDIMVHGLPNGPVAAFVAHPETDWTDGCIAVTDAEIREIWALAPDGTPIRIQD